MLTSMTGFGRAEVSLPPAGRAVVEVHSLNHKFLEVECRLPEGLQGFEGEIRSLVGEKFQRGRVKVVVSLKTKGVSSPVVFQTALARHYAMELRRFQKRLGIPGAVDLPLVLGLPQVIAAVSPEPYLLRWWPRVRSGISQALARTVRMRHQEGRRLGKVLLRLLRLLEGFRRKVNSRIPLVEKRMEKKFAARIQRLLPTADSRAVVAEAAQLAQASDVSEELERLQSHLTALRQLLEAAAESPGRTMDFLAQELHREVNTLGSKVRDVAVIRHVIAMKGHIEKVREQAANVE